MAAGTLNGWIDGLQAKGRYTFLRTEALSGTGMTPEALSKALLRLTKKGRLAKAKKYFYVIVPIEYASAGSPPPAWFIHDLMDAMRQPYYTGLLSAAALHGASHQQPQEFQVVTNPYVRPIRVGRVRIRFFTKRSCQATPAARVKTPTGTMRVSTPEATAIDLVRYARCVGYFGNVATVLKEMAPSLDAERLLDAIKVEGSVMSAQRLGYLLEQVGAGEIARRFASWLGEHRLHSIRLRPNRPANDLEAHPVWRVIPNEVVDVDA